VIRELETLLMSLLYSITISTFVCVYRAQSAMGNTEVEDPFMKLKKRIIWKAVFDKTLSVQLVKKVRFISCLLYNLLSFSMVCHNIFSTFESVV
jgi:hypothetical protein